MLKPTSTKISIALSRLDLQMRKRLTLLIISFALPGRAFGLECHYIPAFGNAVQATQYDLLVRERRDSCAKVWSS